MPVPVGPATGFGARRRRGLDLVCGGDNECAGMNSAILDVEGLTLRAAGKLVLKDLSFRLPPTGMVALMGPVGTGKSSLLKWLCARADPAVYSAEVTRTEYFRAPLTRRNRPLLFAQRQALKLDQMMMRLNVLLDSNPALICVDEPTAELMPKESDALMNRLAVVAQSRAVLVISHNQREMQDYSDQVMLLAGGRLQEITPTRQFFETPTTEAGRQFVGSGWVVGAGVDTPTHHLNSDLRPMPFVPEVRMVGAEGRLTSIAEGKLYVLDLPTSAAEVHSIPGALAAHGIATLVPTRAAAATAAELALSGPTVIPLPDEGAEPDLAASRRFAGVLNARMEAGGALAFLSAAGDPEVARVVAFQLVMMGISADKAAQVAARLLGRDCLEPEAEQAIWDFELAGDLESDGVDPQAFRVESPDIAWIEAQSARPRAASTSAEEPERMRRKA